MKNYHNSTIAFLYRDLIFKALGINLIWDSFYNYLLHLFYKDVEV